MLNRFHIPADPALKNVFHSAWEVEGSPSFAIERILPKGVAEVIFNFSADSPINARLAGRELHLPSCFINGFNKTTVEIRLPERQFFFGIQFQPLAIKKLLGIPAGEFSNSVLDLTLVDPAFNSLWHQLVEKKKFDDRVSLFSNWVRKRLPFSQPKEILVNEFLYASNQHELSVNELATAVCYSARQLSRKLIEATGMNAEEMLLYKRYLHAVHLIHHTDLSLTEIAYRSSFSDQSHFIRSFRYYTNMTPREYRLSKSILKGHLYQDVR